MDASDDDSDSEDILSDEECNLNTAHVGSDNDMPFTAEKIPSMWINYYLIFHYMLLCQSNRLLFNFSLNVIVSI